MTVSVPDIRPARAADATALATLRYEFRAEIAAPNESREAFVARCRRWIEAELAARGTWQCWVAEHGGKIIGMICLQLIAKLPNPVAEREWHGYITSLYVQPRHRGRGLGSALLTTGLAECEARGVDSVILWPTPQSRSLYLRHGFAVPETLLERRLGPGGADHGGAT